jgi:RNA polymerase sigma factor (sigma-70 family)
MEPSNEELIRACRRGDAAAWEVLIARYQRLVYSIPRQAGLDEDRSAEVFQQVFEKLVEHLDRIEQPARIGAWLTTTARREMWLLSHREGAAQPLADGDNSEDETNQLPDSAPLPDEVLLRLEEQHTVRLAVAALDERCRRLLTLLFYRPDPPAYAEIATALEMSEGSIGPTRIRCLQKLRRLLDSLGCFLMYFSVATALFLSRLSQC